MDRSRYKRPATQTASQTTKKTFGSTYSPVPKVAATRPRVRPLAPTPLHVSAAPKPAAPITPDTVTRIKVRTGRPTAPAAVPTISPQQRIVPARPIEPVVAASAPAQAPIPAALPVTVPAHPPASIAAVPPTVLARQLPIDMALPGEESPWHLGGALRRTKWSRVRRAAARGLAVSLVLLITFGGLLFSQSYLKMHKVFKGGTETAAALKADVAPELLKGEGRGRVNILLMGRGGGVHDAPDLTDTIMLASIDPVNHSATLISIPRDLWVNVPGQGVMKLNAAWETGEFKYLGKATAGSTNPKAIQAGFTMVDETISDVLGIDIDYNVLVNFDAFKQAVDTVGGVSINVPTDLVDPTMAWENDNNSVLAKAGVQNFDGKHALIYSRSRETTSDFARAERQRAMLVALKAKVVTLGTLSNPVKLAGLMSAFGNNVQTDLSLSNANRLYSIMKGIGDSNVGSISLADAQQPYVTTGNINGQSVVLPKAGLFKYDDIQAYVRGQLKDPYIKKENAKIIVLNGTQTVGLATTKADLLKTYGYNVIGTGNTPTPNWTQTTLVDLTHKNKYTKNYLEQRLGQTAMTQLSDKTIATNGADFAIIIGSNEATTPQP